MDMDMDMDMHMHMHGCGNPSFFHHARSLALFR